MIRIIELPIDIIKSIVDQCLRGESGSWLFINKLGLVNSLFANLVHQKIHEAKNRPIDEPLLDDFGMTYDGMLISVDKYDELIKKLAKSQNVKLVQIFWSIPPRQIIHSGDGHYYYAIYDRLVEEYTFYSQGKYSNIKELLNLFLAHYGHYKQCKNSIIHTACMYGYVDIVSSLLNSKKDCQNYLYLGNLLADACYSGHLGLVKFILHLSERYRMSLLLAHRKFTMNKEQEMLRLYARCIYSFCEGDKRNEKLLNFLLTKIKEYDTDLCSSSIKDQIMSEYKDAFDEC